jgi:hypothetical protein
VNLSLLRYSGATLLIGLSLDLLLYLLNLLL